MRRVDVDLVPVGSTVARDVFTGEAQAIPLLRAGAQVTDRYRTALVNSGIPAVWIEDELSEGIAPPMLVSDETRRAAAGAVNDALKRARTALATRQRLDPRVLEELNTTALKIAGEVMDSPDVALVVNDLVTADAYLMQHSIDVASLGMLIAKRVFRDHGWVDYQGQRRFDDVESRLVQLGLGLLLHDIGKLGLPREILDKPGKLDRTEWLQVQRHPEIGDEMLSADAVSFLVRAVVRSHHERWEGGGYPDGMRGERIHQFARIASVADVFDAVTSARVYAPAAPAHRGVAVIRQGAGTQFDPDIVAIFDRVVAPYPPGTTVALSDEREGVVADVDPANLDRLTVRVRGEDGGFEEVQVSGEADVTEAR